MRRCKWLPLVWVLSLAACASVPAQTVSGGARVSAAAGWQRGFETQVYPAGIVTAMYGERALSPRDAFFVRVGYNFTDRQDFGEHDHERGGGPGFGMAYRHRFASSDESGWFAGGRADLWILQIDWSDDPSFMNPGGRIGSSDVTVFQPAAEVGYGWMRGQGRLDLTLTAGAEINVGVAGEDVGEGAIVLLGVRYSM
ncbi:MAG: hypothetical protein ACI8QZ_002437 [Chlamydiales bacterium]|jgi:hypothetical protein